MLGLVLICMLLAGCVNRPTLVPPVPTRCWVQRVVRFNPHTRTATLDSLRICIQTLWSIPLELPAAELPAPVF